MPNPRAASQIGHGAVNLDPAVHRAGVHDQCVGLGLGQPFQRQAIEVAVFAGRGDELAAHPFLLQPQHHDHVGPVQRGIEIMERGNLHRLDPGRHQRRGRADADIRTQRGQAVDVRAGDPAVQDIAADRHRQLAEIALRAADRQRIEQALGGVLVLSVAGIEHRAIDLVGDQLHRAGAGVANHDCIGAHRVQRHRRVDQRFALFHARLRGVHVDHVGAQSLAGNLEAKQGAGAVLEEGVDDGQAREPIRALVRLAVQFDPLFRLVEQEQDLPRSQARQAGEVAVRKGGGASWIAARSVGVRRCH